MSISPVIKQFRAELKYKFGRVPNHNDLFVGPNYKNANITAFFKVGTRCQNKNKVYEVINGKPCLHLILCDEDGNPCFYGGERVSKQCDYLQYPFTVKQLLKFIPVR